MTLKRIQINPGVNRENTRYFNENRWYACDKIRFRQGTPEKIGGWQRISPNTYLGTCRSLWQWATLGGVPYVGVGTNQKYYVFYGGTYYDITPIVNTTAAGAITFSAVTVSPFSTLITVNHTGHGATVGTSVTFSGVAASGLGGAITQAILQSEFQITSVIDSNSYTITSPVLSNASDTGNGGASVVGAYQVNAGNSIETPLAAAWGTGGWGLGAWGIGTGGTDPIRIWNHQNFGEDLIYGPKGGPMYYWDASAGFTTRGVALSSLPGASSVPTVQNLFMVSDSSRFVLAFGCNDYGSSTLDPMLIRWTSQESAANWTPSATNQAGSLRLSHGSKIEAVQQVRQEILVFTDTALYGLQYLGAGNGVWGAQILTDNISIINDRAVVTASGVSYWMGEDKFYVFDGRTNSLECDLREYVFRDINISQYQQVFAGTNEQFNEIWWFYPSLNSTTVDRYVIYNYLEKAWYYGNLGRTAWIDVGLFSNYPIAATYVNNLVEHEVGCDDNSTAVTQPISSYITSSEFDLDDGDRFGFVWRVLPDLTFRGSTVENPSILMTLLALQNSGSGYDTATYGGSDSGTVSRTATVPIEKFTGQVNVRVRGRQMSIKLESSAIGVQWQMGAFRMDIRADGRK